MSRRRKSLRCLAAAGAPVLAAALSGCGAGGGGAITVGAAVPVAARVTAPLAVAAVRSVGPGPATASFARRGYEVRVRVTPNRASTPNRVVVSLTQDGVPVTGARVGLTVNMETMDMGTVHYALHGDGVYAARTPAWVMAGRWQLAVTVHPAGDAPLTVALDDRLRG